MTTFPDDEDPDLIFGGGVTPIEPKQWNAVPIRLGEYVISRDAAEFALAFFADGDRISPTLTDLPSPFQDDE